MIKFLLNEKFLIPFLSTLGASLAIIIGQQFFVFSSRQRKKLYCINYILVIADGLLYSNLIVKKKTILPHIEATERIISGDLGLLDVMFKADEFDILTGPNVEFNHLPEEYKLLVGYESMQTLQAIEYFKTIYSDGSAKSNLNLFLRENLKRELQFKSKPKTEQDDILNSYWDYLDQVDRNIDMTTGFISNVLVPTIEKYKRNFGFLFFSKKEISQKLKRIKKLQTEFSELIPTRERIQSNLDDGIQKVL